MRNRDIDQKLYKTISFLKAVLFLIFGFSDFYESRILCHFNVICERCLRGISPFLWMIYRMLIRCRQQSLNFSYFMPIYCYLYALISFNEHVNLTL